MCPLQCVSTALMRWTKGTPGRFPRPSQNRFARPNAEASCLLDKKHHSSWARAMRTIHITLDFMEFMGITECRIEVYRPLNRGSSKVRSLPAILVQLVQIISVWLWLVSILRMCYCFVIYLNSLRMWRHRSCIFNFEGYITFCSLEHGMVSGMFRNQINLPFPSNGSRKTAFTDWAVLSYYKFDLCRLLLLNYYDGYVCNFTVLDYNTRQKPQLLYCTQKPKLAAI